MAKDAFRREVALRLKEARRERTLTQRQLADLGQSTQQNISRYEKGFIPDSWFLLARLHAEEAIDLNWLLTTPSQAAAEPPEAPAAQAPQAVPTVAEPLPLLTPRRVREPAFRGAARVGANSVREGETAPSPGGDITRSDGVAPEERL